MLFLRVKPTGFPHRNRGIKDTAKVSGLSKGKQGGQGEVSEVLRAQNLRRNSSQDHAKAQ